MLQFSVPGYPLATATLGRRVDLVTDIGAAPARGAATRVAVAVATEMPDIEMTAAAAAAAATTDPSSIFSDRAALVRNIYESKSVAAASDDSWEGAFRTHLASADGLAAYALLFARIIHVLEERMNSEKWEDALAFGRTLSPNVSLAELVAVAVAVHHAFPPVIAQKWFDVYRNTLLSRADHATVLLAVDAAWAQAVCLPVQAGSVARTVVASESVANGMSRTAYDDGGESRDFEGRGPETARMACAVLYVLLGSRAHFGSASDKKARGKEQQSGGANATASMRSDSSSGIKLQQLVLFALTDGANSAMQRLLQQMCAAGAPFTHLAVQTAIRLQESVGMSVFERAAELAEQSGSATAMATWRDHLDTATFCTFLGQDSVAGTMRDGGSAVCVYP